MVAKRGAVPFPTAPGVHPAVMQQRAEQFVRDVIVGIFHQDITDESVREVARAVLRAIPRKRTDVVRKLR